MDNAREMMPARQGEEGRHLDLVEETKAFFLRSIFEEFKGNQLKYDLDEEFVKTKRNRSFVVFGSVLATVIVFILFAVFVNSYLEQKNNTITIASTTFDDVSLRDLLDQAKNIETQLTQARADYAAIQSAQDLDLKRVQTDADQQSALLRSRNPSADELSKKLADINNQLAANQQSIKRNYDDRSKKALFDIGTLEQQIAAFDPKKLELARQQEVILNNERQLYDLERDKLAASYEDRIKTLTGSYETRIAKQESFIKTLEQSFNDTLKRELDKLTLLYNPTYADSDSAKLLSAATDADRLKNLFVVPRDYVRENMVTQDDVDFMNQSLSAYNDLIGLLKKVPYQGSIPQIVEQLQSRTFASVDSAEKPYSKFWQTILGLRQQVSDLTDTNKKLQAQVGTQLSAAMDRYATMMGVDSVVVDAQNSDDIIVYVKDGVSFDAKQHALIVRFETPPGSVAGRNSGAYPQAQTQVKVGEIEIVQPGNPMHAKMVDSSFGKDIEPFDIVVKKTN